MFISYFSPNLLIFSEKVMNNMASYASAHSLNWAELGGHLFVITYLSFFMIASIILNV
jgi:hypothetical protein